MNLSRPDRRERLSRLAAEYALGTSPPRVRRRLSAMARRDGVVAAALTEWERRIAVLAEQVPGIAPPPRVWQRIAARLGLDPNAARRVVPWSSRMGFWRGLALASLLISVALAVSEFARPPAPALAPLVVVLAGSDAKAALIATGARGDRYLTLKTVTNAAPGEGKVFELWALPPGGPPKSLGVIPGGSVVRVPLTAPADEMLMNIPALAVSVEPVGGSPTGQPTGPVLYSGAIERMY